MQATARMRRSVQDLFQLGMLSQDTGMAPASGKPTRRSASTGNDSANDTPGFGALLALAETLVAYPPANLDQSKSTLGDDAAFNVESLVGPRTSPFAGFEGAEALASADSPWSHPDQGSATVRDLFRSIGETDALNTVDPQDDGFVMPVDFRQAQRPAPVSLVDESVAADQLQTHPLWDTPMTGNDGVVFDSIGASMKNMNGAGVTAPDLRVVARNDAPVQNGLSRLSTPDLRVIHFDTETPGADGFIERLAGEWESAFVHSEDNAFIEEFSIGRASIEPAIAPIDIRRISENSRPVPIRPDIEAPDDIDEPDTGAEDGMELDAWSESGSDEPVAVPPAAPLDADALANDSSNRPPLTTVPLFEDFLTVESGAQSGGEQEPAAGVRQAVAEVARELRHLEQTGGSELSFSLRLHPEHLGKIEIELQRVNDVWTISIIADHDEARGALAAELSRLENRFRDSQLTIDTVTVVTRMPEEAITSPTAAERSGRGDLAGADRNPFDHQQNRDERGWQRAGKNGILGVDSGHDVSAPQEVTGGHGQVAGSGIDIKA